MISTRVRAGIAAILIFSPELAAAQARPTVDCNVPASDAILHVPVNGNPFTPIATPDGCWIFVTIARPNPRAEGGVVVMSRAAGKVSVRGKYPLRDSPTGAVLTHDGTVLIVTTGQGVAFLDVARLESGHGAPELGYIETGNLRGTIFANVTRDDRLLFVSAENAHGIAVIDLVKARTNGYRTSAIVGAIPAGNAPIALTFSSDEHYLYSTSQAAPPELKWPVTCTPEGSAPNSIAPTHSQGAILVVDVAHAETDPEHSLVAAIPAGCNPVRLALSPGGDVLYATARGDNQLLRFDATKLVADPTHAMTGRVTVGTSPVGVAVFDDGKKIVVTNSNRFGPDANEPQSLTVVDAAKFASGADAVLGSIPAGAFPRELRVTADGRTLLVANFLSKSLDLVELSRVQLRPVRR
jgi:DNA-binding beta-propeller fold protein YncE